MEYFKNIDSDFKGYSFLIDFYNKHTNLAVNFNEKFGESINTHIESLYNIQNKVLWRRTE